jgi:polar amino acid transport system substrate-binding protein
MSALHKSLSVVAAAGLVATLGACSSGDSSGGGESGGAPAVAKDDSLAALVPDSVASDGVLGVGTDASYAPNEFIEADGSIVGFDIDLANAVAEVLGLRADVQNAPFDSLVSGVKTGKYELAVSSFTVNPERIEQVDMPSYFSAGTAWAVPKGNPQGISADDACGRKVAVQKATVQVDDITARSKECADAGKPAITIDQYQLQSDATAAVVSGKDDAMLSDSPVIAYAIQQTGDKLEQLGDIYESAPYGYAVPKAQGDYTKAIQGALQKLMDGGTYLEILKKWGVEAGAITTSELNKAK